MIIKNKLTKETLELSIDKFKLIFGKELNDAINHYIKSQQYRIYLYPIKIKSFTEYDSEFCFDLRWNFNNYNNSNWYIERM